MPIPPENPKIYHITHLRNIPLIAESGVLWSDAKRLEKSLDCEVVGLSDIKARRLTRHGVACHPSTMVGDYVPFYFCPRSIMLYIFWMNNHPNLTYHGGQEPVVHLQADLRATVAWAEAHDRPWAFTDRNAATNYTKFYSSLGALDQINWRSVEARDWSDTETRDAKQAEFLIHESFPWELVEKIGVYDTAWADAVSNALVRIAHRPTVSIERGWYYP